MPSPKVPAKDIFVPRSNREGVSYPTTPSSVERRRIFQEELDAIEGRLVSARYSVDCYDLFIGHVQCITQDREWVGAPIAFTTPDPLLLSGKLLADTTGPSTRPRLRINDDDTTPDLFAQLDHVALRQTSTTATDYVLSDLTALEALPGSFATLLWYTPGQLSIASNDFNEFTDIIPGNIFSFDGTHQMDWTGGQLNVYAGSKSVNLNVNSEPTGVIEIDGTKVLGARGAAVADATGTGDIVARFNELLSRIRPSTGTHALIAG